MEAVRSYQVTSERFSTNLPPFLPFCSHYARLVLLNKQGYNMLQAGSLAVFMPFLQISWSPAVCSFSFYFPSVLSDAFVSSGQQVPYSAGLATSTGDHPSVTRYVWSDHTLPVMDVYCGTGGLRARVATVSLDQTCKVQVVVYMLLIKQRNCSLNMKNTYLLTCRLEEIMPRMKNE